MEPELTLKLSLSDMRALYELLMISGDDIPSDELYDRLQQIQGAMDEMFAEAGVSPSAK